MMASSSSDDPQPKTKPETTPPPPGTYPPAPPGTYPPAAMGYPQAHHPGYGPPGPYPPAYPPSNYPGHPPQAQYPGYSYAQAPPAAYYSQHQSQEGPSNSGFARGIVAALILLLALTCLSSVATWLILWPSNPIVKVESLSVSGLNMALTNQSGAWEAKVSVQNPNKRLSIAFDRVQIFVEFKYHALAMTYVDPFTLELRKSTDLEMRLTAENAGLATEWDRAAEDLARDKAAGTVSFDMKLFARATLRSETWWPKRTVIRAFCRDLEVGFSGANDNGTLLPNQISKACSVYV